MFINNKSEILDLDFFMHPTTDSTFVSGTDNYLFLKNPNNLKSNWFPECKEEEINNFNFRSDNFKKNHEGLHVLFSGCSNTSGQGLYKKEMWARIVLEKINNNSGYFNLSIPGTSIINQIADIFKYCNAYGNPKAIFFNMPNLHRFYYYKKDILRHGHYNKKALPVMKILIFQYYFMLEQYCKTNNIQLYSFSWNKQTEDFISSHFKETFYPINEDDILNFVYEYKEKTNNLISINTKDGHFGVAYNLYWADFIYNKYLEQNQNL